MKYNLKPTPKYRNFVLSGTINDTIVKDIMTQILDINHEDDVNEDEVKDWKREPIYIFINSFGGSVYDGLSLVDMIENSKTPVYTVAVGSAMSMGFWVFLSGHKRLIGKNATLMYHDISTLVADKLEGIKCETKELERLRDLNSNYVTSRSKVKKEQLDDYLNRKAEWYIPAKEAIELGLADEYYTK